MARRYYRLPALSTLAAFEAAARHLSFKNAAQELNVTPGAVSHQIKALEEDLGAKLFERRYRGVELTRAGSSLALSLEGAFSDISTTIERIRQARQVQSVTIGATSAVSSLWLTSAVTGFWKENGDISVNQIVSDQPFPRLGRPELVVRYGRDTDPQFVSHELYRDTLVPVCSPAYAANLENPDVETLAQQSLIHLDVDDVKWTTWDSWFSSLDYNGDKAPGFRVNNYTIALQAAQDGRGVALGWKRLVNSLIADGSLVVLGEHSVEAPNRFHIVSAQESDVSPSAMKLRDWLLASVQSGQF